MFRFLSAALGVFFLSGCHPDVTYSLDGVSVLLKRGNGPDQSNLALAVQLYRQEARKRWFLDADEEKQIWRSLREIMWTERSVARRANYDERSGVLSAHWTGCILDVPFYRALTAHYAERDLTEEEDAWAGRLECEYDEVVCIAATPWEMPQF